MSAPDLLKGTTPGPWTFFETNWRETIIQDSVGGELICFLSFDPDVETEAEVERLTTKQHANAALIASAPATAAELTKYRDTVEVLTIEINKAAAELQTVKAALKAAREGLNNARKSMRIFGRESVPPSAYREVQIAIDAIDAALHGSPTTTNNNTEV